MYDTRSLADVSAGEQVEVRDLFFDTVRSRFEPYGIRAGVTVRCVERSPAALTIVTPAGARVDVPRDHARFVEVSAP